MPHLAPTGRSVLPLALLALACGGPPEGAPESAADSARAGARATEGTQTADAGATAATVADDGQWTMPAKDYASWRFSTLDQITTANAKDLRLVWSFSTGVLRGHEAAPLVVNNTMYVVTPHPNYLYALDATTGAMKWRYDPGTARGAQGVACCDVVNRGAA